MNPLNSAEARNRGELSDGGERVSQDAGKIAKAGSAIETRTKADMSGDLMEAVCERHNLQLAYQRVMKNKGSAGVDGMSIAEFKGHLQRHWQSIKAKLLAGEYIPQPIRQVEIPKPQGGVRLLGIPTLTDRLIQQAIHQVLSPIFEPEFSDSSYGYRVGRSAHQAVEAARGFVEQGYNTVVDMDLEKFFDHMNHDIVMRKVAMKVQDKRVLKLIRRYLKAGVMIGGVSSPRVKGTPQGGPLSPMLSNIVLTELDQELERRGHRFCRYADDVQIYVGSERAGKRVLDSIRLFLEKRLKLRVNQSKSAVSRPSKRKFLGYSMYWLHGEVKLRVATSSMRRFMQKLRQLLRGARGRNLSRTIEQLKPILRGWANYFCLSKSLSQLRALDGWLRRRLRCILWRQWKRVFTRAKNLMIAGLVETTAWRSATNGHGAWWNSGASHMNLAFPKLFFDRLGLVSILDTVLHLQCRH